MSVNVISRDRIKDLWAIYSRLTQDWDRLSGLPMARRAPTCGVLEVALCAGYLANLSAYILSYGFEGGFIVEPLDKILDQVEPLERVGREEKIRATAIIHDILYNSRSQAGNFYLPDQHRDTLELARRAILEDLAGLYEKA